ncbi:SSI family serine proteinase inhibitor [Streptomyces sp. NPDC005438]|uniref:SSI family serine proteinase inhibitor n=1 Tax=Streptomyces sp. NPDC005438 TaxID=3156880 RepID=UPI0033B39665
MRRSLITFAAISFTLALPTLAVATEEHGPAQARDHLTVTVFGADQAYAKRYELRCEPTGGDHPRAEEACEALNRTTRGVRNPFQSTSGDTNCSMIYGGPATATITGTWRGAPVDARFSRENGCEIARWDTLVPVLPDQADPGRATGSAAR